MHRRTALAGVLAAGAAVSGCGLLAEPPPPHPLLDLLQQTRRLRDRYRDAVAAHPGLADRLDPLLADHRAHVKALAKLIGPQASASPSGKPGGAGKPGGSEGPGGGATVPGDEKAALAWLAETEQAAQREASRTCLKTRRRYAGLVGSIAACRAVHRELLAADGGDK